MTEANKNKIFLFIISVVAVCFLLFLLFGCANVKSKIPVQMPDKTIEWVEFHYTRWWNQSIGGFSMVTPSGWEIVLENQNSANEVSFTVGGQKVTIGGPGD